MTAEFATVIPAVMLVLACCLGALQLAGQQLRLQDAAATASRSLARGDGTGVASARVAQLVGGATLKVSERSGMVCVRLRAPGPSGPFVALSVTASSCALASGG
ncbi:MAG: TadE family type IV pilus minor pilin [Lacisediminihabitans sp.]